MAEKDFNLFSIIIPVIYLLVVILVMILVIERETTKEFTQDDGTECVVYNERMYCEETDYD